MIHVDHRDLPREEFDGERGSMQFGDWGKSGFPTPRGQGGPVCIHHCINQRQWWEFKAQSCLHFLPVLSKKKGSLPFAQYLSLEQLNLQTKSCVRRVNNSCYIVFSFCSFLVVCKFHYFDTNETTWQSYYTSLRTTLLYRNYIKYLPLSLALSVYVCAGFLHRFRVSSSYYYVQRKGNRIKSFTKTSVNTVCLHVMPTLFCSSARGNCCIVCSTSRIHPGSKHALHVATTVVVALAGGHHLQKLGTSHWILGNYTMVILLPIVSILWTRVKHCHSLLLEWDGW